MKEKKLLFGRTKVHVDKMPTNYRFATQYLALIRRFDINQLRFVHTLFFSYQILFFFGHFGEFLIIELWSG